MTFSTIYIKYIKNYVQSRINQSFQDDFFDDLYKMYQKSVKSQINQSFQDDFFADLYKMYQKIRQKSNKSEFSG